MKKAQAAGLIGIAFIIIIITFGLLFYVVQSVKGKQESIQQRYQQSTLAASTIYALMKTTIKCDNLLCTGNTLRMDELVKHCIQQSDCSLVQSKLQEFLDFTFLEKGINYKFTAKFLARDYVNIQHGECREKKAEYFFIPMTDKNIKLGLEVCYA
jgi:hypothetical protein